MSTSSTEYPQSYLDQSRVPAIEGTAIAFIVLVTVSFFLRLAARYTQRTGWMWADFFMPFSWIFNLALGTCDLLAIRYGAGRHMETVSESDLRSFTKIIYYALPCIFVWAVIWAKMAILDLYLHVFVNKWMRVTCYVVGSMMVLNAIINTPIFIWQCSPFSYLWNPTPDGHCDNTHAHFTWSSFADVVTDFIMLLLPLPMIWKLQQSLSTKIGIALTFMVGNFGLATSIIRLVEFYYFGWGTSTPDETWISKQVLLWSVIEPGVYHLCACFITFRPLFRWVVYESPLSSMISRVSSLSSRSKGSSIKGSFGSANHSPTGSAIRPPVPNAIPGGTNIPYEPEAIPAEDLEDAPPYSEERL